MVACRSERPTVCKCRWRVVGDGGQVFHRVRVVIVVVIVVMIVVGGVVGRSRRRCHALPDAQYVVSDGEIFIVRLSLDLPHQTKDLVEVGLRRRIDGT